MRRFILGAFVASLAFGVAAQDLDPAWSPSLTAHITFGGSSPTLSEAMQFGAALAYSDTVLGQAPDAPALLNVQFAPRHGFVANIAGQPIASYRLAATGAEGEPGFFANNWKAIALGGVAVVVLAVAGGGGGGDGDDEQSRDENGCITGDINVTGGGSDPDVDADCVSPGP